MSDFSFDCKIDWEQFEKVVGQQANLFKEHCDSFLVLLKMMDKDKLTFNELCSMFSDDFLFDYYFSEDTIDDVSLFHDKVKGLKEELNKCIEIFQEKTSVQVYVDTSFLQNYDGGEIKFYLCLDLLEPTSKGFVYKEGVEEKLDELKKQGIQFEITDKVVKENAQLQV